MRLREENIAFKIKRINDSTISAEAPNRERSPQYVGQPAIERSFKYTDVIDLQKNART